MKIVESEGPKQSKKTLKVVVEKRRRERINHSLEELRTLLLESTHNDRLLNPRMEKADILDFTVQYLKGETFLRSRAKEESARKRYEEGFKECFQQATGSIKELCPSTSNQVVLDFHNYLANKGRLSGHDWCMPLLDSGSKPNWTEDANCWCTEAISKTSSKPTWSVHHSCPANTFVPESDGPASLPQNQMAEQTRLSANNCSLLPAGSPSHQKLLPKMVDAAEKPAVPQPIWRPWP